MLFIIFGLSLFEIITGYVLENGVPFSTTSLDNYFFYDIKQNNTNKIINGSVQIGYQVIIPRSMNYFYMAETTGHSETTDNGNSLIDLDFRGGEEDKYCHLILLLFLQAKSQMQFVFILISKHLQYGVLL